MDEIFMHLLGGLVETKLQESLALIDGREI